MKFFSSFLSQHFFRKLKQLTLFNLVTDLSDPLQKKTSQPHCSLNRGSLSMPRVDFTNLLHAAISDFGICMRKSCSQKVDEINSRSQKRKKTDGSTVFLALFGYVRAKAGRKMLVKSTTSFISERERNFYNLLQHYCANKRKTFIVSFILRS